MLVRLSDLCYRHRRWVLGLWVVALLGSVALAGAFGGAAKQDYLQHGSESKAAADALGGSFPVRSGDTLQVVVHSDGGISAPGVRARAEKVYADLAGADHVVGVLSPYTPQGAGQVSADGTTAYAQVALDRTHSEFTVQEAKDLVLPVLAAGDRSLQIEVGGDVAKLSQSAPLGTEGIGLLAAAIILLLVFGSAVAMGLPLITALFGLGSALMLGQLLMRVVDVPDWAPPTAAMVGLGVGIDYALLIVTRFRGGLAEGLEPRIASLNAIATAGRSVVVAGSVVIISILGIMLVGQRALNGFAFTVSLAVLITMAAALTLLPAMLGFAGRNIERLHVPRMGKRATEYGSSRWYRWSRFIQRRALVAAGGSLVVLLALAAPFLGIRFGFPDAQNDPAGYTTHRAFGLLAAGFGPGFSAPLLVTVQGGSGDDLVGAASVLRDRLAEVEGVTQVSPVSFNERGDTGVIDLVASTAPQAQVTENLVDTLRDTAVPRAIAGTNLRVHVGGATAVNLDITRGVADRMPLFLAGILLAAFLLLMLVFRSVVVPLKAVIMNLLASAAAFGILTLAVSGGRIGDLVGIPERTPVPILIPIGIFAILFGLSMDYEVFLISRIKEEYDKTGDNAVAVADGLAKSARVITAGAAVMVTVFLSFVLGQDVFGKMFGIGLAAAVLVDATIVRMVLVPATMELLGDRNWWLPGWLDGLLPQVRAEGHDLSTDELDSLYHVDLEPVPVATP
ncbi:MMPL family transporter [Nocardioides pocheonensis]|nr:MMPL family transporter [Nocardioides pocheonensis]